MIHTNVLLYRRARYLWIALVLIVASFVLYATQSTDQPPNGGTWQGYALGTIGALLIVWLAMLAIRKRRYRSQAGTVQGWTSAHIYLGTALLVVATLHCGLQFGANVHTLAYVLMCVVVLSGFVGIYAYLAYPSRVAANRQGVTRSELFGELYDLDKRVRAIALRCTASIAATVDSAIVRTTVGGGVIAQLAARDRSQCLLFEGGASRIVRNVDQQSVIDHVAARLPRADKTAEAATLQELVVLLSRRQVVLRRIRQDIRFAGWMKVWLYVHLPVTVGLLFALVIHILVTFAYW